MAAFGTLSVNGLLYGSFSSLLFLFYPCLLLLWGSLDVFAYCSVKVSVILSGEVLVFPPLSSGGIILGF